MTFSWLLSKSNTLINTNTLILQLFSGNQSLDYLFKLTLSFSNLNKKYSQHSLFATQTFFVKLFSPESCNWKKSFELNCNTMTLSEKKSPPFNIHLLPSTFFPFHSPFFVYLPSAFLIHFTSLSIFFSFNVFLLSFSVMFYFPSTFF